MIQDLRFNHINDRVKPPERPVNPRFVDYAADVAYGTSQGDAQSVILDFEAVLMAVPSSEEEARFNCCLVDDGQPIHRPPGPRWTLTSRPRGRSWCGVCWDSGAMPSHCSTRG